MKMIESKFNNQYARLTGNALLILSILLLTACLSGNYQAPMADISENSERHAVVIVTESDDRPSRYIGASSYSVSEPRIVASRQPAVHTVVGGESLYSIAFQYDLDFRSVALANNLSPPYTIFIGQQLRLDSRAPQAMGISGPEGTVVSVGTVVSNNSVARAQPATSSGGGVQRQPIATTSTMPASSLPQNVDPIWQWPVRGQILGDFQVNSGTDKGIDIEGLSGQSVNAAASGDVVYAGNGIQGSDNLIIIRHSDRFLSAYANNRTMLVTEGDQIRAGDRIAEIGISPDGVPMLHFEIRMDGTPVDPLGYLPRL